MIRRVFVMQFVLVMVFSAFSSFAQESVNASNNVEFSAENPVVPADYKEEGVASWYGEKFQGKVTASGEPYDMDKFTAAHNYLPLGVKVTVTNLANNKKVDVIINDRGPFVPDRIIDLSRAAAHKLDFMDAGKANVRIESYWPEAEAEKSSTSSATIIAPAKTVYVEKKLYGAFYIQAGAYKVKDNADRLVERLEKAGFSNTRIVRVVTDSAQIFKVQIGMYKTLAKVRAAHLKMGSGFPGTFILADVIQEQ